MGRENLNERVGTPTANMLREASSFSARPLAAWRFTVAMLWQSISAVTNNRLIG